MRTTQPKKAFYLEDATLSILPNLKNALLKEVRALSETAAKQHIENFIASVFCDEKLYAEKQAILASARAAYHSLEKRKPQCNAMFNSRDKVLFETALAGAIHKQRAVLAMGLWPVASKIAIILEKTLFNHDLMESTPQLQKIHAIYFKEILTWDCRDEFNKTKKRPIETPIINAEIPEFKRWVIKTLRSSNPNDVTAQIFLIHIYVGFITRPDRMHVTSIEDAPEALFLSAAEKNIVIKSQHFIKNNQKEGLFIQKKDLPYIGNNTNALGRTASRVTRRGSSVLQLQNSCTENPPQNIAGIVPGKGARGSEAIDLDELPVDFIALLFAADLDFQRSSAGVWQACLSEADRQRRKQGLPISPNNFYEEALRYNMPLIGGASGGIGTYEVAIALTEDLSQEQLKKFRMLVSAIYISKGFHSIHEIAEIFNCSKNPGEEPYLPGNYYSFIPRGVICKQDLRTLQKTFPKLLPDNAEEKGFPDLISKL